MFRIGIDVGGTFTDLVAIDFETGEIRTSKSLSTANPIHGVKDTITKSGLEKEPIKDIYHGTTVATNALLQRVGPKVGFITTKGFRDILYIQMTRRKYHYGLKWDKPIPLAERKHCYGVTERVNWQGEVIEELDIEEAREAILKLKSEDIKTIAISFLFSYLNPVHEIQINKIIEEIYPEATVTLSSEIDPQWKEYKRASTAVSNAFLKPSILKYAHDLEDGLEKANISGKLLLMKSNGGVVNATSATRKPIDLLNSGPAGGVLGATFLAQLAGIKDLITMDMGGTSFDVSLIPNQTYNYDFEFEVEWNLPIRTPTIDITSIGAGGGSIAWVDEGGLLRVGPRSAGSNPGPICYGRGGKNITVTDANLILGRLNPKYLLGGDMELSPELTEKDMIILGKKLSMDRLEIARSIIEVINHNMVNAIDLISLDKGYDPREFKLLSFGGAGSLHASALAKIIGIPEVVVPVFVGGFSAFGLLTADVLIDTVQTLTLRSDKLDLDELNEYLANMKKKVLDDVATEGYIGEPIVTQELEMRYLGQNYGLDVEIPSTSNLQEENMKTVYDNFHKKHEEKYGYSIGDEIILLVNLKTKALGSMEKPVLPKLPKGKGQPKPKEFRGVYAENSYVKSPIYWRDDLLPDNTVEGPAIIEEKFSTTFLNQNDSLTVDEYGNLIIKVG